MIKFRYKLFRAIAASLLLLLVAACGTNPTTTPTPLNPGLFPPPGTTGPDSHTPVITPLSDGAAGPVTLPPGSATARPLDSPVGTAAAQPLVSPTPPIAGNTLAAANNSCVTPNGWVAYTVQAGDTLSILAAAHGITVAQLTTSNCLTNADVIDVGQVIYVPGAGASGGNSITVTP